MHEHMIITDLILKEKNATFWTIQCLCELIRSKPKYWLFKNKTGYPRYKNIEIFYIEFKKYVQLSIDLLQGKVKF